MGIFGKTVWEIAIDRDTTCYKISQEGYAIPEPCLFVAKFIFRIFDFKRRRVQNWFETYYK